MLYLCCVPNCKGNYLKGPKVAVFRFPKESELRQKWIQATKRENFTPTNSSRVCELHLQSDWIETKTTYRNEVTEEVLEAPLKRPRLALGAVPSKLPDCPSYLSKADKPIQVSPETKRLNAECHAIERAIADSIQTSASYLETISYSEINEAFNKMSKLEDGWVKVRG